MSTLSGLISAGGGGALPQIALTQSQTWVPPQDGNICIHVIGAGGAGFTRASGSAESGGAGGYCKKNSLAVTTSGSYTVVVGVGGPRTQNGATTTNGGNSTVAGTGLSATLTANGGIAGVNGTSGAGGSAANGDVNNTGGAGTANGGGGAVGVYGTGAAGVYLMGGGQSDAAADGIGLSGFGQITGGRAGGYATNVPLTQPAGALSGGAISYVLQNIRALGGDGGIGGGGGSANAPTVSYCTAGAGGDGIVLIQYLPS